MQQPPNNNQPPYYGPQYPPYYAPQPPPKKKRTGLWITLGIAAVVVFACIGAASHGSGSPQVVSNATTSSTTETSSSGTTHYKTGQTVSVDKKWDITLNAISTTSQDTLAQLKPGDTYLLINMTFKNISNEKQVASSLLGMELHGVDGTKYDEALFGPNQGMPDGDVAPGQLTKGNIPFEVPVKVKQFELNYSDLLSNQIIVWDINA